MKTIVNKLIAPAVLFSAMVVGASPSYAYTVEEGDTMYKIAKNHDMKLSELAEKNKQVEDLDLIFVGQEIKTDNNTKDSVNVKSESNNKVDAIDASVNEKDLLAKLVEAEAKAESYKGKVAVAEVVLNRVEHETFPDSIEGVIYQRGQFTPVSNGAINKPASEESKDAVAEALNGSNLVNGALFFWNPDIAPNGWLNSKETVAVIGNHEFKK